MGEPNVKTTPRGIEVIIEDVDDVDQRQTNARISLVKKAPVLWQKITTVLRDNRLVEHESTSPALNTIKPNDQRLLKKFLNVIFLTTGICLLCAIIVVIIYTSVVPEKVTIEPRLNKTVTRDFEAVSENATAKRVPQGQVDAEGLIKENGAT